MATEQPNNPENPPIPQSEELDKEIEEAINPPPPEAETSLVADSEKKTEAVESGLTPKTTQKHREFLIKLNTARDEYARWESQKYSPGLKSRWKKRTSSFNKEYEAVKANYEKLKAEYYGDKIKRFLREDSRLEKAVVLGINPESFKKWVASKPADSFDEIITTKDENGSDKEIGKVFDYDKALTAYQETAEFKKLHNQNTLLEKVKDGLRWLGDQNLSKTEVGQKIITKSPRLGGLLLRAASLRTAIGFGLLGAGAMASVVGGGVVGFSAFALARRAYLGGVSTFGYNEMIKGFTRLVPDTIGKRRKLEQADIDKMMLPDIIDRLQSFEYLGRTEHRDITKDQTYLALKKAYETDFTKRYGEKAEKFGEVVKYFDDSFRKVESSAKKKALARRVTAVATGTIIGGGFLAQWFGMGPKGGSVEVESSIGAPRISPELLAQGQAIDSLSRELGMEIPNLAQASPKQVADYLHHLQELDKSFVGAGMKGLTVQEFMVKHPEMFKGGQAPSAEEITVRLNQDIKISTVAAGEGIQHKGIQQILDNPRKFGYTGDLDDIKAVKSYANRLAHEAAMNTEVGGKAVVGVTSRGEAYDLWLKADAIGDKVELVQGADGQWHYEFGPGLKADEFYEHIARPEEVMSGKSLDTSQIPWLDKKVIDGTITELILDKTDKGLSVVDFHSHNGQVNGAFFLDSTTHEFLPHYVDAALADDHDHYLQLVSESYAALTDRLDKVSQVAGEIGQNWTAANKLELASFATEHTGGTGAAQTMRDYAFGHLNTDKLHTAVAHLGQRAPLYLEDSDFRSFVSDSAALHKLNPSTAEELWQRGAEYKGKGFKSVDYGFLQEIYGKGRNFAVTTDGKFLSVTHSPITGQPLEVPVHDMSSFDHEFYNHYQSLANKVTSSEYTVFNKLKSGLGESGARGLMEMNANDFTGEGVRSQFGKSFLGLFNNHNFLDKWQTDIASHIKNSSGATVGERLHNYLIESKGEWEQVEVSEELAKSKTAALEAIQKAEELEARLRAQDAIEKAEKLLEKK